MTDLQEKARLLTGETSMTAFSVESEGISPRRFADASHGLRLTPKDNATYFPNLCCLAATWDRELSRQMGEALAAECARHWHIYAARSRR